MNDWLKVLVPIAISLLLALGGFFLNQGRIANCESDNDLKAVMREILLTAPSADDPEYRRFLDRSFQLLEPRECTLL